MPTPALRQPLSHSGLFQPHSPRILCHARACGVWDQGATVSLVYTRELCGAAVGSGSAVPSGAGLKAAPWLRLREDAVVMEERQAPRCSTCDTTALARREGSSHRLPDTQGCLLFQLREARLRPPSSRGQCPPRAEQSSPMFHTPGQSRGLMLQNRGSGSWPRGTSCFVLVTAALREETRASPLHPLGLLILLWFWSQVTHGHACPLSGSCFRCIINTRAPTLP